MGSLTHPSCSSRANTCLPHQVESSCCLSHSGVAEALSSEGESGDSPPAEMITVKTAPSLEHTYCIILATRKQAWKPSIRPYHKVWYKQCNNSKKVRSVLLPGALPHRNRLIKTLRCAFIHLSHQSRPVRVLTPPQITRKGTL